MVSMQGGKEEEKKDEEMNSQPAQSLTIQERCLRYEMGFSLVIKEMIDSKKPLIGHNCMYDWIYVYNQFIGKLPETYLQFAQ